MPQYNCYTVAANRLYNRLDSTQTICLLTFHFYITKTVYMLGLVLQPNRLAITDRRYCLHEFGTAARRDRRYFFLGIKFRKKPALLPFR